jgi:hypothetical protein
MSTPVLGGRSADAHTTELHLLPPLQFDDTLKAEIENQITHV